jgi:DNA repair photolyase
MSDALQQPLFADGAIPAARPLPVIGEQRDISYFGASARTVLNGPETTGMPFWSINPYTGCAIGCQYCYARYAHRYAVERVTATAADVSLRQELADLPPWLAFERRILVKRNAADALRLQLRNLHRLPARWKSLRENGIGIGTATDPYQPAERRYQATRSVLEVLAGYTDIPVSITTKSPLVTRDIDVLKRIAECAEVVVHMSLITADRELARRLEPRAPTPEARLRAVERLRKAGIDAGFFIMPVLPGITDVPEGLDILVKRMADTGATHIAANALHLRATARRQYLPFIEAEFPELASRYRNAYAGGYMVSEKYRAGLRRFLEGLCAKHGVRYGYSSTEEPRAARRAVVDDQLGLGI